MGAIPTARRKIDYSRFSAAQLAAARMKCDPETKWTNVAIAEKIGVAERTIYRWLEDPEYIQFINDLNEEVMDTFAIDVYRALRAKVLKGDVRAIELAMKRMGVLIDKREVTSDIKVEIETLAGKTNDQLLAEIAERERALNLVEVGPDVFGVRDVVDD